MKRAARKNGVRTPANAIDVECVHNGKNQQCFARDPLMAHPECIRMRCSVCCELYTMADTHEPGVTVAGEAGCFHVPAVEKNAAKISVGDELDDLDQIESELRML